MNEEVSIFYKMYFSDLNYKINIIYDTMVTTDDDFIYNKGFITAKEFKKFIGKLTFYE